MTCPWCVMRGLWFLSVGQCNGFPLKPSWCVWEPFGNFKLLDAAIGDGTWREIILLTCVLTRAQGIVVVAQSRWVVKDCLVLLWLVARADAFAVHAMRSFGGLHSRTGAVSLR